MSMYWTIKVFPAIPDQVPETKNFIKLLDWLAEKSELSSLAVDEPLEVERWMEWDDYELEGEIENFSTIGDDLAIFLDQAPNWSIFFSYKFFETPKGLLPQCFELPDMGEGYPYHLDDIFISRGDMGDPFDNKEANPPPRFTIRFVSDMKAAHPFEDPQEYFDLVWPRLISAGVLAQIEKILGLELQGEPDFV